MTRFSTPRTTPPPVATPIAVDPSLIASREYSTWKRRPSGEKVLDMKVSIAIHGGPLSGLQRENLIGNVLDTPI